MVDMIIEREIGRVKNKTELQQAMKEVTNDPTSK